MDSSEPAAAPELADPMEPEPLIPEASLVALDDRGRIEVVSAVLDVFVPISRAAGVPMRSVSLWPQPTSATRSAVAKKDFFISCSSYF